MDAFCQRKAIFKFRHFRSTSWLRKCLFGDLAKCIRLSFPGFSRCFSQKLWFYWSSPCLPAERVRRNSFQPSRPGDNFAQTVRITLFRNWLERVQARTGMHGGGERATVMPPPSWWSLVDIGKSRCRRPTLAFPLVASQTKIWSAGTWQVFQTRFYESRCVVRVCGYVRLDSTRAERNNRDVSPSRRKTVSGKSIPKTRNPFHAILQTQKLFCLVADNQRLSFSCRNVNGERVLLRFIPIFLFFTDSSGFVIARFCKIQATVQFAEVD